MVSPMKLTRLAMPYGLVIVHSSAHPPSSIRRWACTLDDAA
jgi:hypothetical protein